MTKSRKQSRKYNTLTKMTETALPVVGDSLKTVGYTAKGVIVKAAPLVENGASAVYGTLATGFDMGIKGAKTVAKGISKKTRSGRTRKVKRKTRKNKRNKSKH
jgi:hypothetical protein